jgi:serine/threonine-protein kinase
VEELAFSSLAPTPVPSSGTQMRGQASAPRERTPTSGPVAVLPRRLGRYHLFAHIGRGGMADIHLAHADTGFGDAKRLVVIKEMRSEVLESGRFVDMLVSEAKLAARLSHANIVAVEDLGRVSGSLFIAMEYVEGLDLRELLRCCAKDGVALPIDFSLRIVIEALRGLSFAHRARDDEGNPLGIVHRDVSPSNVLLSFHGEVKLCDFGIARALTLADAAGEEVIAGKAGYMSPEQARGDALDARADVFAAGIILWELLAGRRLYRSADSRRLLDLARAAVIPPLPLHGLPRESDLHAIVERALAADRDARYPSAAAMLGDLEEYVLMAGMMASEIRFGAWLLENFGEELVQERRARERAMRAFARGPVALIQPLPGEATRATPCTTSFLPEFDETPSRFLVAPPAADASIVAALAKHPRAEAPVSPLAAFAPRLLLCSLSLVALAYFALRHVFLP